MAYVQSSRGLASYVLLRDVASCDVTIVDADIRGPETLIPYTEGFP
jgi:hypothetical protein